MAGVKIRIYIDCLVDKNKKELKKKIKKCEYKGLECEGKIFRRKVKGEMNYCQIIVLYDEWE